MKTLSTRQRKALTVLQAATGPVYVNALARALHTSPAGAIRTAASLVRRGQIRRRVMAGGLIAYETTQS